VPLEGVGIFVKVSLVELPVVGANVSVGKFVKDVGIFVKVSLFKVPGVGTDVVVPVASSSTRLLLSLLPLLFDPSPLPSSPLLFVPLPL
jgi:hypothetical protein